MRVGVGFQDVSCDTGRDQHHDGGRRGQHGTDLGHGRHDRPHDGMQFDHHATALRRLGTRTPEPPQEAQPMS